MRDWAPHVRPHLERLRLSPAREAEIVDELSQHLDDRYRALTAAGATEADALRVALAEFTAPDAFARRMAGLRQARQPLPLPAPRRRFSLAGFLLDLRYAWRRLHNDRGFTAVAVLTLALGIGANAAVFSAVATIQFRPLPFPDSSRLVNVWLSRSGRPNWHFRVPPADAAVIQSGNRVFESIAMYDSDAGRISGDGEPEELIVATVSASFFSTLGVSPALGRSFSAADEEPPGGHVIMVSDRLWRRRFSADAAVLGTHVRVNDVPRQIVGVMPPGFDLPDRADVWRPRDRSDASANAYLLARLSPHATVAQANADMTLMVAAITDGRPNPGMTFTVEPLKTSVIAGVGSSWVLLLAAVGSVLAIGCLNISNLMLARGLRRQREIAVRAALGASRGQIMRGFAAESLLLAFAGGVLSLGVAYGGVSALRAWAPPDTPRLDQLVVEPTLFGAAIALSALAALVCGLLPVVQCSRFDANASLRDGNGSATTGPRQWRVRNFFVVMQIAAALVLVVAATLLVRSLVRLTHVDSGFRTERLLTVTLHLSPAAYPQPAQRMDFVARTLANLRSLPGVTDASASTGAMMTGSGLLGARHTLAQRITREGVPAPAPIEEANLRRVDTAYIRTLGMRILGGRDFSDGDRTGARSVAIVNQVMARTYWGTEQVVGKRVSFMRAGDTPVWLEIIGVVNDTRDIALSEAPRPAFFVPLGQDASGFDNDPLTLYLRTAGDPLTIASAVRKQVWSIDPNQPIADVSTMELAIEKYVAAPRFRTALLAALAALGLLLALIGIYGVTTQTVTERRGEIAIRLALGAERRQMVRLMLAQGCRLAAGGSALGLAGSLAVAGVLRAFLFEVAAIDPITLMTVAALVLGVAIAACYPPATRAAAADVIRGLHHDRAHPRT
jgi:putative ABC transport system permease protein